MVLLPFKCKNVSDLNIDVRICTRSQIFFLMYEFMNICDNFQTSVTQRNYTLYSVSKHKYRKSSTFFFIWLCYFQAIQVLTWTYSVKVDYNDRTNGTFNQSKSLCHRKLKNFNL